MTDDLRPDLACLSFGEYEQRKDGTVEAQRTEIARWAAYHRHTVAASYEGRGRLRRPAARSRPFTRR